MNKITDGIWTFTRLRVGRVYLVEEEDGYTLIDASLPNAGATILAEMAAVGLAHERLKRIVITHAHPDHVGAIPALKAATGAEVIVPAGERAAFDGEIPIPSASGWLKPPKTILKGMRAARTIVDGDVVGSLQAVATAGHAPGHLSYWHSEKRVLFTGDVIFHVRKMRLPYKPLTVDMDENVRSIGRLAHFNPTIICFGHGAPITENATQQLRTFAQKVGAIETGNDVTHQGFQLHR